MTPLDSEWQMVGVKWRHKVWGITENIGKYQDAVVLVTFLRVILIHHYSSICWLKTFWFTMIPQNPASLIINSRWTSVSRCGNKLKVFSSSKCSMCFVPYTGRRGIWRFETHSLLPSYNQHLCSTTRRLNSGVMAAATDAVSDLPHPVRHR